MLQTLRVRPLDSDIAAQARETMVDRVGNALSVRMSEGQGAPCRHCLREVPEGQGMILIGHSPFTRPGPFREVGPIFICAEDCARYATPECLPDVVRNRLVQLRAYSATEEILYDHSTLLQGTEVEAALPPVFDDPRVAFVHLRSGLNGCFLCQVEAGEA